MLEGISSEQFSEWMAYDQLDPIGEKRADIRMGILASVIANSSRGKNQKVYTAADFIPQFEMESEEEAGERLRAKAFAALGGRR